jgi:3-methyladenine DNA glycosylase AlkD
MCMDNIINKIRETLINSSDEKTRQSGLRFFKENVKIYGVKTATVTAIGKDFYKKIKDFEKNKIFALCEELWQSGYLEETGIACNWSYNQHKNFLPKDFVIFEKWVNNYVSNWASCDTFCNHTLGTFIEMYPEYIEQLIKWTSSENRWVKRASAVSLIIPARKGLFLYEIFLISDKLLTDKDDLVQKGYGWMLKVASQANQSAVFDYVMKNKLIMPRTALRYAIEKMPLELKKEAMKK